MRDGEAQGDDPRGEPAVDFNILADERDVDRMEGGIRRAVAFCSGAEPKAVALELFLATFSERVRRLGSVTAANALKARVATWLLDGPAPFRRWFMDGFVAPGADAGRMTSRGRQEFRTWIKQNVTGFYHVAETCRLGSREDQLAVVGSDGTVHGVSGLRVADASIMPVIVRPQTNLTAMMIGEKLADAIRTSSPP